MDPDITNLPESHRIVRSKPSALEEQPILKAPPVLELMLAIQRRVELPHAEWHGPLVHYRISRARHGTARRGAAQTQTQTRGIPGRGRARV